jgi:cytochrome c oxidase assembly protein subunit 15
MAARDDARSRWPHRLAVGTAATTVLLIFVGGLVTNTGSALAVPDWPTSFGYNMFLYPWSKMVGGIFYEHSHRLIGSTVGVLTVALALSLWLTESRQAMRVLGLVAVVAVIIQGVLGGLRVVLLNHGMAIVHGCVAQAFFALLVGLAVATSRFWAHAADGPRLGNVIRLRSIALTTVCLVYLQIVFGALLTHTGTRLDAHLLFAALVTASVCWLAVRVLGGHRERAELRRPALLLLALLVTQLSLGLGVYLWRFTTANEAMAPALGLAFQATHRITGTAVLGTAVVLALRLVRLAAVTGSVSAPVDAAERRFAGGLGAEHGREVLA